MKSSGEVFYDSAKVELSCPMNNATIRYTLSGKEPNASSPVYSDPIIIRKPCIIKAMAVNGKSESMTTVARFVQSPYPPAIYAFPYSSQYNGGGSMALTDGRIGTTNYQGGNGRVSTGPTWTPSSTSLEKRPFTKSPRIFSAIPPCGSSCRNT